MNILSVENISKSYGMNALFNNISFGIDEADKIGVVGINGTGKSTLLNIVAGKVECENGKIFSKNGIEIRFLSQNPHFDNNSTIIEHVFNGSHPMMVALRNYESAVAALEENPDNALLCDKLQNAGFEMDRLDAWNLETHAKNILYKLGMEDLNVNISTLSGGQKKYLALAEALIQPSDLLILDEPTNHLDQMTILWLEDYLNERRGALLIVTHDRYFLNRVANRILEIDNGEVFSYEGNFEYFVEKKAQRYEMIAKIDLKNKRLYERELDWMRKGPKARTTKQKARIQRFEDLENGNSCTDDETLDVSVGFTRLGKKVIEIENLSKSYGEKVLFKDFNFIVKPYERVGIIGGNGSGKSTLLNIIAGKIQPDHGTVSIGETVKIGYYAQGNEGLEEEMKVIDWIREIAEFVLTADGSKISASQMLERFLFQSYKQHSLIKTLSGGERRRLILASVLMTSPNVLIFDEPTNDLDIQTLEILEEFLEYFRGALIVVSHDRYFINKTTDHILAIEDDNTIVMHNDLLTYIDNRKSKLKVDIAGSPKNEKSSPTREKSDKKIKFTFSEKKEFEEIDDAIEGLEESLVRIQEELNNAGSDYVKLGELSKKNEETKLQLSAKLDRWTYLNELYEKIQSQSQN